MRKTPEYRVPALEKGLDILETLAGASGPLALADLADSLGRSGSELFRMLNCLERRGYIGRMHGSGRYGLTLKLYSLAHRHSVVENLRDAARRPMEELVETIQESCHLSILDREELLVIRQEMSPDLIRLSIEVGGRFNAAKTVSGRLLLAQLPENVLEEWLDRHEITGSSREAFCERLHAIRVSGISREEGETIAGVHDLAVLVGGAEKGVQAALTVTRLLHSESNLPEEDLITALKQCADDINHKLGI